MTTESDNIEKLVTEAKLNIELGEALENLRKNKDFKKLFLKEYLNDYAVKLVTGKASPGMQDEKNQAFFGDQINAIGHLNQFLHYTKAKADHAKDSIVGHQDELQTILEEEL